MFALTKPLLISTALCALAAGLLAPGLQGARAAGVLPAYYDPGDALPLAPLVMMRHAPPPIDNNQDETTYAYGPITDSLALNVAAQNGSTWSGHSWPLLWANRARVAAGHTLNAPNPIYPPILDGNGNPYGVEYTTVARANAATKAQVLYTLGAPPSIWEAPLLNAGVSFIAWSELSANPDDHFTSTSQDGNSTVMVDEMPIPTAVSTSARGVGIDYEVQDDRPTSGTNGFLADLGSTIRSYGKKAYLYTNPWDGGELGRNGFAFTGIDNIKAHFDYISLFLLNPSRLCDVPTGYGPSVTFLRGVSGQLNFSQILVTVDETLCTPADAIALYQQRRIDHFAGYNLFPDGAVEGGSTLTGPNRLIWYLLHG